MLITNFKLLEHVLPYQILSLSLLYPMYVILHGNRFLGSEFQRSTRTETNKKLFIGN